jgi:hypothetical protein
MFVIFDGWVDFKKSSVFYCLCAPTHTRQSEVALTSETVEGLSLTLEGIDNIHGSDSLAAGVLSVGNRVTDDVLEEDLQHTTSLFIDETRDTLDTTTTGKTTDSRLGNALDIVAKNLSVTLGSSLSESLSSLTAA